MKKKEAIGWKYIKPSSGVVNKRKGGGSLIESPPIFSDDGKYIFVNGGWCVRVFSIKTGECVRVLELHNKATRVLSVFSSNSQPCTVTSNLNLLLWDQKSGTVTRKTKLECPATLSHNVALNACLAPSFIDPTKDDLCVLLKKSRTDVTHAHFFKLDPCEYLDKHPLKSTVVKTEGKHNVAFGGSMDKKIMACITDLGLFVYSINGSSKSDKISCGKGKEWVCVGCHPCEPFVAAGDSLGRVVLFRSPINKPSIQSVYHWHTLPCQVVAFTPAGSTIYSGGGEHVLVKWNTENPNIKNFLPRLSAPIVHITISSDNNLVAVSTLDNGIILVDSSYKLKCVLQQLAWGVLSTSESKLFPAGICYDPRSRAIILNSRPGHLQFFQPETEAFLFSLDVTQQNYLTQERSKEIIHTEVTKCVVSDDSCWVATIESRCDKQVSLESRVKFWHYSIFKRKFCLNTCIDKPHNGVVECVRFRPGAMALPTSDDLSTDYLLVTTGRDNKFRLWSPLPIDSIYRKGVTWSCESVGSYKNKKSGPACFSEDGSILAAAFENVLTIWSVETFKMRISLSRYKSPIRHVEFGRSNCCHLVVTCTQSEMSLWNLLTLSVQWSVQVSATMLLSDPLTQYMALFSINKNVYIFNPLNAEPVYIGSNLCAKNVEVLSAKFIPRENPFPNVPAWLQKSLLYYIDSNQELKCFESDREGANDCIEVVEDEEKGTVFSNLIAKQKSDQRRLNTVPDPKKLQFGVLGASAVQHLLKAPAHTMPPMSLLCSTLLESLALSKKSLKEREAEEKSKLKADDIEEMSVDESSSDEEEFVPTKGAVVIHDETSPSNYNKSSKKSDDLFFFDIKGDDEAIINNFSYK